MSLTSDRANVTVTPRPSEESHVCMVAVAVLLQASACDVLARLLDLCPTLYLREEAIESDEKAIDAAQTVRSAWCSRKCIHLNRRI